MDPTRFDDLLRSFASVSARRAVLGALSAAVLGLGVGHPHGAASAKKDKKSKKKPLKLNAFGCVNVDGACQGKDANCCSGICDGEKPKKGKKDKSKCLAHDTGTGCFAGQINTFCGGTTVACTTSTGSPAGVCDTTTGNAPYCTDSGECFPCKKDKDCVPICGAGAACAKCPTGCASAGGTVCVSPTPGACVLP
jgi:hypothetical protein